jgi:hypothetical protein
MAAKLKIIQDVADIVPAPQVPEPLGPHGSVPQRDHPVDDANGRSTSVGIDFDPAPTRKRNAGWTAERQRKFIEHLALTGNAGEAAAIVGVASSSAYRLRNKAGADSFARAWDAALRLAATRGTAIAWDRALNGRVERFYKDGDLVMERRIPSDYLLTWLLSRLDPLQFGSPAARALAAATGDPREKARQDLPGLVAAFEDVASDECACEPIDFLDGRLGETGSGEPIEDHER